MGGVTDTRCIANTAGGNRSLSTSFASLRSAPSRQGEGLRAARKQPHNKNPGAEAPGFSYVRKLHGEPVRQRIGDRINDRLRLVLTALAEDIGSDAKTSLNKTHVTLPLS